MHRASLMRREPSVLIGSIVTVLTVILNVVVAVQDAVPDNATWLQILFAVVTIGLPLIQATITRQKVYAPDSVVASK